MKTALMITACAMALGCTKSTGDVARARGAVDLGCDEQQVVAQPTGENVYLVRGCGKELRYTCEDIVYYRPRRFGGVAPEHEMVCEAPKGASRADLVSP